MAEGPTEIRLGLDRRVPEIEEIRKAPVPTFEPRVSIWSRITAVFRDTGDFAMEKKHDIWSTLAGLIPGVLLIILELAEALPDEWRTYITAGALIILGFLTNSWDRLLKFLPELVVTIIDRITGSRTADPEGPDDDEIDVDLGAEAGRTR